jgi:hypothetical protein
MSDHALFMFQAFFFGGAHRFVARALDAHADASTIDRPIAPAFNDHPSFLLFARHPYRSRSIDRTPASFKDAIQFVRVAADSCLIRIAFIVRRKTNPTRRGGRRNDDE